MANGGTGESKSLKGRPKGGARFPRYSLRTARQWVTKLVSKTHLGPQARDIISVSVVDARGTNAEIKISALNQYGLIEGSSKAYNSTELARSITNALPEEVDKFLAQAALSPTVFKGLYDAFHGDEVSTGKLRQRAADLLVHPESLSDCIKIYIESLEEAGLISIDGDKVYHRPPAQKNPHLTTEPTITDDEPVGSFDQHLDADDPAVENPHHTEAAKVAGAPRAIFNVNVSLDSSLDTEKLERQLGLLKRFGAI